MPQKTLEEIISNRVEIDYVKSRKKTIPISLPTPKLIRHTITGQKPLDNILRDRLSKINKLPINENTKLINKMIINSPDNYIEIGEPTDDIICTFPDLKPNKLDSKSTNINIDDHTKICKYKCWVLFYILIIILLITINNIILLHFTNLEWN